MSKQDTIPRAKPKKFLFDLHDFDDKRRKEDEAASAPPPPPTFTEQELETAKAQNYAQGRLDGNKEAQASFEKQTADLLGVIRDHMRLLFEEEERRSRLFEKEAVQLAVTLFARAFPAFNEKHGLDEVKGAIEGVLETMRAQPEIVIDVPPSYESVIRGHIEGLQRGEGGPRCTVRANADLGSGSCRMGWVNGSAMRDASRLLSEIERKIEQVLADKAILTDNNKNADNSIPPASETAHE
jgi:flagellar assembly protein FliH